MPNFTPEDLLLYQSGELDREQSEAINEELSANWALREKLTVLIEAFTRLNSMKLQAPRKQTLQSIMRYATHKQAAV